MHLASPTGPAHAEFSSGHHEEESFRNLLWPNLRPAFDRHP
jgi:hypothetical protein